MDTLLISAYMITFNNERTVEKALQSLSWADEIVVVDSFSTDSTVDIIKKYTKKFYQRKFNGHQEQYKVAAGKCKNDWLFFLDADEVVNDEMQNFILKFSKDNITKDSTIIHGYLANRRTFYIDRWIKYGGWEHDSEYRFYHKDYGDWTAGLHSTLELKGATSVLKGMILHYTYGNISDQIKTIDKYSDIAAKDMLEKDIKSTYFKMLFNPIWRFIRDYFLKKGFLDGFPGFVIAVSTMYYIFIKYAKLKELDNKGKINE